MPAPGAPFPRRAPRVVAGRLVDQAGRVERQRAALQRDESRRADRRLARPDVGAAVAADDLDRVARRLEDEIDGDLAVGDADRAVGQRHPAAAQDRALPEAVALAVPYRPEGLRNSSDVHRPRAQHQLGPVRRRRSASASAAGVPMRRGIGPGGSASPAGRSLPSPR